MKKIWIYLTLTLCLAALTACELKEERTYNQTPDERLQKVLTEYTQALTSAPSGWLMAINTGVDGGYQLYLSFNNLDRVVMFCDMDATHVNAPASSLDPGESSYLLKALQMPSLLFDTYNYIHFMADPQGTTSNGGTNGIGLKSDFEFDILSFDSGTFNLRGTYNKCTAYLTRATSEEAEAVLGGGLKGVFTRLNTYNATNPQRTVDVGGQAVKLTTTGRTTSLTVDNAGTPKTLSSGSWMSLAGDPEIPADLRLFSAIEVAGKRIVGLKWNGEAYDAVDEQGTIYTTWESQNPE